MHRLVLPRVLRTALLLTIAVACGEPALGPTSSAPRSGGVGPHVSLVEDNTTTLGTLIKEVTIVMSPEGSAFGSEVLFAPGTLSGPIVIEISGDVTVPPHEVPVTELLAPGVVMWFHQNGDLFSKFSAVVFFELGPDGSRQLRPLMPSGPHNQIRFGEANPAEHGYELLWEFAEPEWSGRNTNDEEWQSGNVCRGLDDNVNCWEASLDRISDAPPRGTIVVRVYQGLITESVRIRAATGQLDVAPVGTTGPNALQLVVEVLDAQDVPLPNRSVSLSLAAKEGTAGHTHVGGKAAGTLSQSTVPTGASGMAAVTYTAPVASGPVAIRGTSPGALEALDTIRVRVPGLISLPAGTAYSAIGLPSGHEGRHHGTPAFVNALRALADSLKAFADLIPSLPDSERPTGVFPGTLGINDMSLAEGGLFDLNGNWIGPHADHRVGTNADIDVRTDSNWDDYAEYVHLMWVTKLKRGLDDERVKRNHFHLK